MVVEEVLRHPGRVSLNGHPTLRYVGNLNLSFSDIPNHLLQQAFSAFAFSSGQACLHSSSFEPSYVLQALRPALPVQGVIRLGLSRFTTYQEVALFRDTLRNLMAMSV